MEREQAGDLPGNSERCRPTARHGVRSKRVEFLVHIGRIVTGGAVSALALLASISAANAQTTVWQGTASSDWSDPANWSLGVPALGYSATDGGVPSETVLSGPTPKLNFVGFFSPGFRFELNSTDLTVDVIIADTLEMIDSDLITAQLRVINLNVEGDSMIEAERVTLDSSRSNSVGLVDGPQAVLHTDFELSLYAGEGEFSHSLTALNGATVETGEARVGYADAFEGRAYSDVEVNLLGGGTTWTNAGVLYLASAVVSEIEAEDPFDNSISAKLVVADGAQMSNASSRIGVFELDGDAVAVEEVEYADLSTAITGGVEVDGNSSAWENTGTVVLSAIGKSATTSEMDWSEAVNDINDDLGTSLNFGIKTSGDVAVTNGARVTSAGLEAGVIGAFDHVLGDPLDPGLAINLDFATRASVSITGAGSTWTNTGDAVFGIVSADVGDAAQNVIANVSSESRVLLADGGLFSNTGDVILARDAGAQAILAIGAEAGGAATSAGTLEAQSLAFGAGNGALVLNHTETDYVFDANIAGGMSGAGAISQLAGRSILTQDSSAFTGTTDISGGQLQVNGALGGDTNVASGATLEGTGTLGNVVNAGIIAPGSHTGNTIGTLTVSGNYTGNGGELALGVVLGNDGSLSDRLAVLGDTAGQTNVRVTNIAGPGAETNDGIRVVEVGGLSNGTFSLLGDYVHEGQQAVIGGAYAYKLYQGAVSAPADGNWYLRSALVEDAVAPLYQPGVPTYEAYPQALLALNQVETLQQRIGNRYWTGNGAGSTKGALPGVLESETGAWVRLSGKFDHVEPGSSTSDTSFNQSQGKFQAGIELPMMENAYGALVGGVYVQTLQGKTNVFSPHGDGTIATGGTGIGTNLTWYGSEGFYFDAQAQAQWYNSNLASTLTGASLVSGNDGFGYALSVEAGQRIGIDDEWSVTPQAQLTYSEVTFDNFQDVYGADVSLTDGRSLVGRVGVSIDRETSRIDESGKTQRTHLYGVANIEQEFLGATRVDVAGVGLSSDKDGPKVSVGIGASHSWDDDKFTVFGDLGVSTSLTNFGSSYGVSGNVGFRVKF
jgi:outer membrane autotransporter protein